MFQLPLNKSVIYPAHNPTASQYSLASASIFSFVKLYIFDTGTRIKEIRKKRGLTQEQLAEKINVSPHYIYEIERGLKTMSIYTLANVAEALNVSIDYLVSGRNFYPLDGAQDYTVKDNLDLLIEKVPLRRRNNVFNILKNILPYIK